MADRKATKEERALLKQGWENHKSYILKLIDEMNEAFTWINKQELKARIEG